MHRARQENASSEGQQQGQEESAEKKDGEGEKKP
jgi:hypothetical protein